METIYGYAAALFGVLFSVGGAMLVVGVVLGWVLCYYTARRHPSEAAMINATGTKYGTKAKEALKDLFSGRQ